VQLTGAMPVGQGRTRGERRKPSRHVVAGSYSACERRGEWRPVRPVQEAGVYPFDGPPRLVGERFVLIGFALQVGGGPQDADGDRTALLESLGFAPGGEQLWGCAGSSSRS
jgi:hypothetical protein